MPTTKEITLYQYSELSDSAKETARQWWNECRDSSDFDYVIEDFERIANMLGIELDQQSVKLMGGGTRSEPNVSWSVGYCQSDFAAFDGRYSYAKGSAKALAEYTGNTDSELVRIATGLQEVQARYFYSLTASVKYHHYYGQQVETDCDRRPVADADHETVKELLRDLARWLYQRLRDEDEYQSSDEQVAEAMAANEYTFRENGRRED